MAREHEQEMAEPQKHLMAAREDCIKWLKHLRRGLQGLPQAPAADRARRELHGAVMTYYDQLRRFRHEERLAETWYQEPVVDGWTVIDQGEEQPATLEALAAQRLAVSRRREQNVNPNTNAPTSEVVEEPWTLARDQALAVIDQLDTCAHMLGFDITPTRQAPTTGAGQQDVDLEDVEYLNNNPLEMSANGDD